MIRYALRRLLSGVVTVWFIATATFFAMHAVPGDPLLHGKNFNPELRRNLVHQYGLDQPLARQYLTYLKNMAQGDFGISFVEKNRRVNDIISEHFPVSALLGALAIAFAAVGGVVLGAFSALCRNRLPSAVITFCVILAISVPSFVFAAGGQLLLLKLREWLGFSVLPIAGWGTFAHMLMPAVVLGLGTLAYLARLMRSAMLEVAAADYMRTARAKGLSSSRIFFRHQLRNAILPLVTVLGPAIAVITTGGFVVELVYSIPGLGRYFVQAVQQLDYTVIMGTTVFYGAFLVTIVVVVDIIYGLVDPRISAGTGR
jgi:ABC-type dipeptide/oligopeptide/nickel transport system permease component